MTNYDTDLAKPSFTEMKLIDYGIALPSGPDAAYSVNTYVMFNAPFSGFMFKTDVKRYINSLLETEAHVYEEDPDNHNRYERRIKDGVRKLVDDHVFRHLIGHIPYMESVGSRAYGLSTAKYRVGLKGVFTDYCTEVVLNFTNRSNKKRPRFDTVKYWKDVLQYNLDVWGFLTTFLLLASYSHITHPLISDKYLQIVGTYLYNTRYAAEKIPVDSVVESLNEITSSFKKQLESLKPDMARVPDASVKKITVNPKKATKTKKKRLVIVKEFKSAKERSARSVVTLKAYERRCPKGYVRHKKDKTKCVKSGAKTKKVAKEGITLVGKRCPKGYKRHKTEKGRCVSNTKK
jgi:hypothetical protein